MKKISILLTRQHSFVCQIMYYITGRCYTHASISLDDDCQCFYSFNFNGFSIEHPHHRMLFKNKKESLCLQLEVSDDEYQSIQKEIESIIEQKNNYQYNYLGIVLSYFHIPIHRSHAYFCSQFVADILNQIDTLHLQKHSSYYLPNRLMNELNYHKRLCNKLVDII